MNREVVGLDLGLGENQLRLESLGLDNGSWGVVLGLLELWRGNPKSCDFRTTEMLVELERGKPKKERNEWMIEVYSLAIEIFKSG